MSAKEIAPGRPFYGWYKLHTVVDKSSTMPVADVALYISSSVSYPGRHDVLINALKEQQVPCSVVPLTDVKDTLIECGGNCHSELIRLELSPATTKEDQIAGIQATLRRLGEVGRRLGNSRWEHLPLLSMGKEDHIASIVGAVEAIYDKEACASPTDPSRFKPKGSHVGNVGNGTERPPQAK